MKYNFKIVLVIIRVVVTGTAEINPKKEALCVSVNFGGSEHTVMNVSRGSSRLEYSKIWLNSNLESNSGRQVVILGCLLGVLILIVYGFKIYRAIQKRKARSTKKEEKYVAFLLSLAMKFHETCLSIENLQKKTR